ncbi:MAG: hypothetical protein WBP94_15740 [Rhodomicrobiaceae bacterium]
MFEPSASDDLEAARTTLDSPLLEDTGWSNASSIEKPGGSETEAGDAGGDDRSFRRGQANVMPFPTSAIQRSAEPTPSEMLRGGAVEEDGMVFGSRVAEPAEEAAEFEPEAHDALADAVQSALRNVYGGRSPAVAREAAPDFDNYTVGDSLKQAAAERSRADQGWDASPGEWREDNQEGYFEAETAATEIESNTEAVLDYLYSQRRGGGREGTVLSADASLRDFGEASGYGRDWQDAPDFDDRAASPGGLHDFGGPAFRGSPPLYAESADRSFLRDRSGYRGDAGGEQGWGGQGFAIDPGAEGGSTYPVRIPAGNPESLASSSPDSSHLLGAAGLGLIGGIALAGVLAVFVFNSFVDEGDQTGAGVSPKVVERLGAPSAEPARDTIGAGTSQGRPSSQRSAALAPERQPVVETPRAAPTAPPQPEPVAAADASGAAGAPIALDIKLGDVPGRDEALVSIKGLPSQAKLSTGIDVGGGQWLLPPARLHDLTVTVPEGASGSYSLEVQLLKDDAQTSLTDPVAFRLNIGDKARHSAANLKVQDAGVTSATNAEQAARLAALPDETPQIETDLLTQMLIRDGNKLMRGGDIAGARRLYEQAATNGNPEAALAMGRSYDPSYFEKLPVKTGKPDPATAFEWYKKALDGGLVTARVKIDGLKQWLQR